MKLQEQQNVGYRFADNGHRSEKAPMLLRVKSVGFAFTFLPHYHYSDDGDTLLGCCWRHYGQR